MLKIANFFKKICCLSSGVYDKVNVQIYSFVVKDTTKTCFVEIHKELQRDLGFERLGNE